MMNDQMMDMMSMTMPGMDMALMQGCLEACSAAEQASTMCADASSGEGMGRMMSMCMDTADMTNTMMRVVMRPMGHDTGTMMSMLTATATMCMACADECSAMAEISDHAKMCAQVCMNCAQACQALMDSMASMASAD
ncbi:MAG TPA: hypothetical protein VGC18_07615 [Lacisediminihabitans sp.]|uniref:hypothetical protein n=1 Tax=Lacisediminihabitans sp. TaxID=2787631 RepID=UPI002EDB2097